MQELYAKITGTIAEAHQRLQNDLATIREREQDWMHRDFEIRVRWAQYILETADLERERMWLLRELAFAEACKPIIAMITT
jgi:hypothetical protein